MAEEKQQKSIFQGVMDAIGSGKRRTPPMQSTSQFSPSTKTSDLVKGGSGGVAAVENVQQQFLDWQVNKISHNLYTRQIYFDTDRLSAYQDFRAMDMSPEIAAALNIMRDECLSKGDRGEILGIYSENERVKSVLKDLFTNRLNVEYNMKLWIRELMKYGDYFVLLKVDKEDGIYSFLTLPPEEIHREDGYNGNPEDVRFRWDTMGMYFDDWQVAHFRIIEDSKRLPFGRSILDPARKLWKQLQLAEDSMLVYRMCLAGDTRVRTDHGYKYIKDICEGDRVISYNKNGQPEYSNVVYHVNNGKKKLLRIRSKHNEIVCTETHPILVNTGGVVHYVDAKDIVVGKDKVINASTRNLEIKEKKIERIYDEKFAKLNIDYIKIFKNKKEINKSLIFREIEKEINYPSDRVKQFAYLEKKAIPYDVAISFCDKVGFDSNVCLEVINKGENNSSRINLPEYINEELARLLGFIIGDGYIRKHGFGFATGVDNEVNEYYRKLIEKYFGKVVFQIDKRSKIGTGKYCVSSKTAADILRNLGINDLHKTIRIPEWVFNLPYNKRKEFVLGISDADGCERRTNKGTWFSTIELSNKKLVEDIKELWHSIGFASGHLKSRFKKGGHCIDGRRIPSSISYSVTISEIELPIYENVILIEDAGEDFVYDISVDNDLHNFIANGIPVHNTRAPERRVFYIEVGNLADQDVQTYMMKIQNQLKKQPVVDTRNGQYNLKYDPMNITEDFFIPIRGDKASKIDTLPGANNMSDIADVNYLQDKLFASLQVPKAYLNYAENLPGGSTLSQADLRFARTINSIQEVVLQELRRIANIHLYFTGLKDEVDNFTLTLTNPSTQQELLKLETMKARMEVFKEMYTAEATSPVSYTWAMENILGFSKAEIKLILKQKKIEKRLFAEIDSSVETYKKIGLFRELDAKYELPGAQTSPAAADETEAAAGGGGGGGGAGELGNLDLGSQLGGMEAGGGATPEAGGAPEGGAAPEATPEAPLAESRKKVIKETFKQSDEISESLVEDLLGKDIGIKKTIQERNESENALQKNNVKINFKLKSLMDNIEKSLDPDRKRQNEQGEQLLREERSKNTLFERSSDIISKTNDTLSQIESLISGEIDDVEISESSGSSEEFIVEPQDGISNWDDDNIQEDQENNQVE